MFQNEYTNIPEIIKTMDANKTKKQRKRARKTRFNQNKNLKRLKLKMSSIYHELLYIMLHDQYLVRKNIIWTRRFKYLVLTPDVPHSEANVLVFNCLNIESWQRKNEYNYTSHLLLYIW